MHFSFLKVIADFVERMDSMRTPDGKIDDLYCELNKWSLESKFHCPFESLWGAGIEDLPSEGSLHPIIG